MFRGRPNSTAVALLAASALMLCTASAVLRNVFSMPITLRANWVFRVAEPRPAKKYLEAVWRVFALLAIAPLWSGFAALLLWALPWRAAAAHLVLMGLLGVMLTDVCAGGLRKIPFTCSYQPGKGNLQFAVWGALALPAIGLRWWTARRLWAVDALQFEDMEEPQIVSLELTADAVAVG